MTAALHYRGGSNLTVIIQATIQASGHREEEANSDVHVQRRCGLVDVSESDF